MGRVIVACCEVHCLFLNPVLDWQGLLEFRQAAEHGHPLHIPQPILSIAIAYSTFYSEHGLLQSGAYSIFYSEHGLLQWCLFYMLCLHCNRLFPHWLSLAV